MYIEAIKEVHVSLLAEDEVRLRIEDSQESNYWFPNCGQQ